MEQGWEPEVKRYFRKILNTLSASLLWLITAAAAGFYFGLAVPGAHVSAGNIIFYILSVITFALLLVYFFRLWKK